MTSRIEVFAHCADNKEVIVLETDNVDPAINERTILQNGESENFMVYDNKVITVQELLKV